MRVCIVIRDQMDHATVAEACSDGGLILVNLTDNPEAILCCSPADLVDLSLDSLPERPAIFAVMLPSVDPAMGDSYLMLGVDDLLTLADLTQNNLDVRMMAARFHRVDLSRGKQALERLTLFESVVLNANDAVLITDPATRGEQRKILYANAAFSRISGYTMDEVLGRSPSLLQGPLTDPKEVARIREAVTRYEPVQAELVNYHKNGTPYWIEISIVPVINAAHMCTHFVAIQRDVTTRKYTERELVRARREAEQASFTKSRFLASASHDLRQPIQALTFLTSVLNQKTQGTDLVPVVDKIGASLQDLSGLLNAILDISRLEAGVTEPEKQRFHLSTMMERISRDAQIEAQKKNLRFKMHCVDLDLYTDPILLERMIRNLVSNALKYTQEGGVFLAVRKRKNSTMIEVYDTGLGIPQSKQKEIFEEFRQLHNQERQIEKGLGLGLSIVQRIAHLLEIRISVRSRVGRGSCFRLHLQEDNDNANKILMPEAPVSYKVEDLSGINVLLVEDNQAVREAMQNLLEAAGAKVSTAANGQQARAVFSYMHHSINAILSDYRLTGAEDGVDLLKSLMATPDWNGVTILVTGETGPDRIKKAKEAKITLLFKPVDAPTLTQAIANALNFESAE